MDTIKLTITEEAFVSAKDARAKGQIPMVYYGKGLDNRHFSVDYQDFRRAYEKGGRSTIITLVNEKNEELPALVHDVQYEPVSDDFMHVDLKAVDMNKVIHTQIPLVFVGISPAVKDEGGVLMTNREMVEVECLPKDLIHEIEVDISPLVDFHTTITVGDIKAPDTITILDAPELNVATVTQPRALIEEEVAPAEGEEGEEGEEKAEGEEGEEGEGEAKAEGDEKAEGEGKKE